jgi:hypothetical protein
LLIETRPQELSLVHAEPGADTARAGVRVTFSLDQAARRLTAHYEVRGSVPNVNPGLARGSSQWGLWDWDVVELFVTARGAASLPHYFELVVSPLGQQFELEIHDPRIRTNRDFVSGFAPSAAATGPDSWTATMSIPLDALGWDGQASSLVGNAFAILGPKGKRGYWGLTLPSQDKPDFHLPRYFAPLLSSG